MKILYVSPRYNPHVGGVETHVEQLATRAVVNGHHVEVLTQEDDRSLPAVETIDGVTVHRFRVPIPSQNYAFAPAMWLYLIRYGKSYDIVHAHGYHTLAPLLASFSPAAPLIFTPHYHGTGHSPFRRFLHIPYRLLGAWIFARSSRVICVSDAEACLVHRHFPFITERVNVLHNGVDVDRVCQAKPYPESRNVILSAGRIESYKHVDLTIRALAHLDNTFVLRITGNGSARASLVELVAHLGLQERVEFLGYIETDTLYRWMRTSAVYVSMSSNEANPITPLEALIGGSGIVASDIPAHREIAASDGLGAMTIVSLDASPETLAQKIRDMAERRTGGSLPIPNVASWERITAETIAIYVQSLTSPRTVIGAR